MTCDRNDSLLQVIYEFDPTLNRVLLNVNDQSYIY
jgi:hypothetical protein